MVGNHYLPPPSWYIDHGAGANVLKDQVCRVLDISVGKTALLFTGAHMDHLAVAQETFRNMQVTALVTAGVATNAVRMAKDIGRYYEPGTINILLHTNMHLSSRAMTRAIISATEAKSAALSDLDIRSSFQPLRYQATGTGTDNIIVVPSPGEPIDNAGGHCKMGELIAKAVYRAVQEAIVKQNSIGTGRSAFQRLKERQIDLFALGGSDGCACVSGYPDLVRDLEHLLLDPHYAGFIESALAISDAHEKGLVRDLTSFDQYCRSMAQNLAGRNIYDWRTCIRKEGELPQPLSMALEALLNGLKQRNGVAELTSDVGVSEVTGLR